MAELYPDVPLFDLQDQGCVSLITDKIRRQSPFGLRFYFFSDEVLDTVRHIITILLEQEGQSQFEPMLYGGLKEIIINGSKANLKRAVYEDHGLNLAEPQHVEQGIHLLKQEMKQYQPQKIAEMLKQRNLYLILYLFPSLDGLRIEVANNSGLSDIEETIIRKKFRDAERHNDILEFMESQSEVLEGAGLGIFMFVLMMKKMGIHPGFFRIGIDASGHTISRIEIPFTERFESIRQPKEKNLAE